MIRKFVCVFIVCGLALFSLADAFAAGLISFGNQNDAIADLQEKLKTLGYFSGECTGYFDGETQIAIENFQKANHLSVTGTADPDTLRALEGGKSVTKRDYIANALSGESYADSIGPKSARKSIRKLQNLLLSLGYDAGKAEGEYNAQTEYAVRMFQWFNLLPVTGVADPETMRVMTAGGVVPLDERVTGRVLRYGDQGSDVKTLQNALKSTGFFSGECSGKYGRKTQEAVVLFQKANALQTTGECDVALILMLLSGECVTRAENDRIEAARQVMLGDEADCVSTIKAQLTKLGFYRGETGALFTQELAQAVSYFQDANGIPSTGIADAETREALNGGNCVDMEAYTVQMSLREAKPGDEGYSVILLQTRLRELGYLTGAITGIYEESTRDAVVAFQRNNHIPETGIADPETRARMNRADALSAAEDERTVLVNRLCETARGCVSKPYEAGKVGPEQFGNAGLLYYCFQSAGVELPPTTALQLESARQSETWSERVEDLSAGRQVFMSADGAVFTLLCVGDGAFVYASNAHNAVVMAENVQEMEGYELIGSVLWF